MIHKLIIGLFLGASLAVHSADTTVTNRELGFEITFPEGWHIDDGMNKNGQIKLVAGILDSELHARLRILVGVVEPANDVSKRELLGQSNSKIGECHAYKTETSTETSGKFPGVHPPEYRQRKTSYYCAFSNDHLYFIAASSAPENFDKFSNKIEAIVKSFKVIEAK